MMLENSAANQTQNNFPTQFASKGSNASPAQSAGVMAGVDRASSKQISRLTSGSESRAQRKPAAKGSKKNNLSL